MDKLAVVLTALVSGFCRIGRRGLRVFVVWFGLRPFVWSVLRRGASGDVFGLFRLVLGALAGVREPPAHEADMLAQY
ncbi:MAG TPA: hypothetical protein VHV99_29495, partial [Paraburkholderia sp.]|nr:hypothetical protein [Paraburkholderia sp.]